MHVINHKYATRHTLRCRIMSCHVHVLMVMMISIVIAIIMGRITHARSIMASIIATTSSHESTTSTITKLSYTCTNLNANTCGCSCGSCTIQHRNIANINMRQSSSAFAAVHLTLHQSSVICMPLFIVIVLACGVNHH